MTDFYEELSQRRKRLQEEGSYPDWYSTGGFQMFESKYLYKADGFKGQALRIAKTAAKHLKKPELVEEYNEIFFNMLWRGWLSPSTPVLANTGTDRGMPVSCSGTVVEDSISGFYENFAENAVLTQEGFGTASYLGNIRPRGSSISRGGKAAGVMPVLNALRQMSMDVSQGSTRRGAIGQYLPIDHGDFWEVVFELEKEPDSLNIGWCVSDQFISKLKCGDEEANKRFKAVLHCKMVTGKGYFFFPDKVNRHNPQMYKDLGLEVVTSQLCSEITLYADKDHSFTCVLSSLNLSKYNEWKDTDTIFHATVFLDCIASEFIEKAKGNKWLEKAVRFTEKSRALGLGVAGFHTYLMQESIPVESFEAHMFNNSFFSQMSKESTRASQWLAKELGEPEWCKGYGVRNTHTRSIAPTKSTSLLMGGISEGINLQPAMAFTQASAAGEIKRIDPTLLSVMKEKGVFNKKVVDDIIEHRGSVQHVDWLTEHEKKVFKTGFEVDQKIVLRLASVRGKHIDQWQSLNLNVSAEEDEGYIADLHTIAFVDEGIRGLYYIYSKAGVVASKDVCEACQ